MVQFEVVRKYFGTILRTFVKKIKHVNNDWQNCCIDLATITITSILTLISVSGLLDSDGWSDHSILIGWSGLLTSIGCSAWNSKSHGISLFYPTYGFGSILLSEYQSTAQFIFLPCLVYKMFYLSAATVSISSKHFWTKLYGMKANSCLIFYKRKKIRRNMKSFCHI